MFLAWKRITLTLIEFSSRLYSIKCNLKPRPETKVDFWFLNLEEEQLNKFLTELSFILNKTKKETTRELHGETITEKTIMIHLILKVRRGEIDLGQGIKTTLEI